MIRYGIAIFLLAAMPAAAQQAFQLPSGNIHCREVGGALRCDILQYGYTPPPRPAACALDYGGAVRMTAHGPAGLLCHGDTVAAPQAAVLDYGATWRTKGISCVASQAGLRCVNEDGRGFTMARAALILF